MQKTILTAYQPIHTKITVPGSKSITQRALLIAALADGVSELSSINLSKDVLILIHALRQLGIVIQLDEITSSCIIAGCNGRFPKLQSTLWCGDSYTILRYLIAACGATPGVYYFDGSTRLHHKSLATLLNIIHQQGAQFIPNEASHIPFTLIGTDTFTGSDIKINHAHKTQIICSLLLIAPYARSAFNFIFHETNYYPNIDMSCSIMAEFGVLVHRIHQGQLNVPVPQRYTAKDYIIEPDFSYAAYFFAAAIITKGELTIQATKRAQSKQPNVKFFSLLEKMGCEMIENHTGLTVKSPTELHGIDISIREFSDLFAVLCIIAPFAVSPTRISHLGHLSTKEQKRLANMTSELNKLNIHVEAGNNWIKILPSAPKGALVRCDHDHRLARAFSIMGVKIPNIIIDDAECVTESFPDFFMTLEEIVRKEKIKM
ncbi:MAG: 3-phosphoshikimate 1-carboxyvinyltransferase [uncultured bacterium]|nr:MAG: 3-phosphoshikimate 1-carboxyvinyltransferase [uncultured bacterium]